MDLKLLRNIAYLFLSVIVFYMAYTVLNNKNKIYESNKELFNKTIYNEAKTHFENLKIFRAWNSKFGGIYVKSQSGLKPNKYLTNNHLYTKDNELLVKINPAWMTRQLSEMMNAKSDYKYKITSLKPLNPDNKANSFEKEALKYFEEHTYDNYFTQEDKQNNMLNFMGKLIVEKSCLNCHSIQGYKEGEVRGGISVSIPMDLYEENWENLDEEYTKQILLIVVFSLVIFIIGILVINSIYKNQKHLKELKDKYKILYDRYDYAVSGSKLGLWDWNLQSNEVYFSPIWKELLGFKDNELENDFKSWEDRVHPDDKEKTIRDIKDNHEGKTELYENIHRLKHKDGSWQWILDKGKTIFDKNGKALRMVGFHTNITKQQELEHELLKLKVAIDHSPISIVITNIEGNIEYVNPHFSAVTGFTYKEAIGQNPRILKSKLTSPIEYNIIWDTLLAKKTWRGTFKNIDKEGNEFWESAIITPILDDKNEIINYLAVKQEITKEVYLKEELKDKEEMMIAQSRHAAMGEMISMIAHQWRQPISVISMAANNTLADIELDMVENDELKENTESILDQTKYLSQTIEDFRNFFKPNKEKEIVKPKDIIDETLKIMLKSLENNNIVLTICVEDESCIEVHSRELLQVFINIIKNAKEALVSKNIEQKEIKVRIYRIHNTLRTSFTDNAGGVKESIIDKIFDPYFSTKDEKTGTGLGLYMCKTIVNKHFNGVIGVYNSNDGACFYVDLPIKD
ncbi:PAS domain S-box protein [Poseidonibacter lekithochrous]|uniref:PAS domain S-box protein n=1 Tax=Poseidonibacter lekithochrous TaxID=1904463 RepID=UPI000D3846ED|nr:PAS domain S-box protein [Poseidonibacter lekithochrous]